MDEPEELRRPSPTFIPGPWEGQLADIDMNVIDRVLDVGMGGREFSNRHRILYTKSLDTWVPKVPGYMSSGADTEANLSQSRISTVVHTLEKSPFTSPHGPSIAASLLVLFSPSSSLLLVSWSRISPRGSSLPQAHIRDSEPWICPDPPSPAATRSLLFNLPLLFGACPSLSSFS